MYRLQVKMHFDAAHRLVEYEGKCNRLHGHRWDVEMCLESPVLNKQGMVMDFGEVKSIMNSIMDEKLDHNYLNDTLNMTNPTAEKIAAWIYHAFDKELRRRHPIDHQVHLARMTVWESPECCVKYSAGEMRSVSG